MKRPKFTFPSFVIFNRKTKYALTQNTSVYVRMKSPHTDASNAVFKSYHKLPLTLLQRYPKDISVLIPANYGENYSNLYVVIQEFLGDGDF